MISTATHKGQVTIPKRIRDFLNLKPGDKISFSIENDKVILHAVKTLRHFRGSVAVKGQGDLDLERREAKAERSKNTLKSMK